MGGLGNLAFFTSVVNGLEDNKLKQRQLSEGRQKFEHNQRMGEIELEKAQLDLESKRLNGELDNVAAGMIEKQLGLQKKAFKANAELSENTIDNEESRQQKTRKALTNAFNTSMHDIVSSGQQSDVSGNGPSSPSDSIMPGMNISMERKVGPFSYTLGKKNYSATRIEPAAKVMGALKQNGHIDSYGELQTFNDRNQAMTYAATQLGDNFETKFPKAMEYINKNFPPPDSFGHTVNEIKTIKDGKNKGNWQYIGNNQWERAK